MTGHPADGERGAVRGYQWQYDHAAALVYDAIRDRVFNRLRLVDSAAGGVDDLVLVREGWTDAYQFRSSEHPGSITFNRLVRPQRGQSLSTISVLAQGWQQLRERWPGVRVHFVAQQYASTSDRLPGEDGRSPGHFSALLRQVLVPVRTGELDLNGIRPRWQPALTQLHEACRLDARDFAAFLGSLHLDVATPSALPAEQSQRRDDIASLSSALQRCVAEATDVVELDTDGVLGLMDWSARTRLRRRHEFPVDLDTYAPLTDAVDELRTMLESCDSGYVALVGPPGSGKSTLLSQGLTGSTERVVRYYAYVPDTAPLRTAMTAMSFLHDVVLMLGRSGLRAMDHLVPSSDTDALRQALHDHLDAASSEFTTTGRRTIIVVDGLDHVHRDLRDDQGLLAELPRPEELPAGVLFVVGSQTLDPLGPQARAHIEENDSVVDLRDHRLPRATVLEICARAPSTAQLPQRVHERVAELSDGHPLALRYLINMMDEADEDSAEAVLSAARPYGGDVAEYYRHIWESLQGDDDIVEILAFCSRLRVGFKTQWLRTWAPREAVQAFRQKLRHLFREHVDGWRFFHDSFRQFAADRTALGDDGRPDDTENAAAHQRVAELCAESNDHAVAAEELYHWFWAGQDGEVLRLARQATFREQRYRLRSAELIRADIESALGVAAERANVEAMLQLILALFELDERGRSLDEIDIVGLLHDGGLVEEAVTYCGDGRGIPVTHAYGLAANLAEAGDPSGRRIFDLLDPGGLAWEDNTYPSEAGNEAAAAWARAAIWCRPLDTVLGAARTLVENHRPDNQDDDFGFGRWVRYGQVMRALIDTAAQRRDTPAIDAISSAVLEQIQQILDEQQALSRENRDTTNSMLAVLVDIRVRAKSAQIDLIETTADRHHHLDVLATSLEDTPLLHTTTLDLAELFARHDRTQLAVEYLDLGPYHRTLTVSLLGYGGDPEAIDHQFRYWRLRFLLRPGDEPASDLIPPDPDTPAGNDITSTAPVHSDADAISLAAHIDSSIRTLARIDAASASGQPLPLSEAWTGLVRIVHAIWQPNDGNSATLHGIIPQNSQTMVLAADVAVNYGGPLPQRLADALALVFEQQLQQWRLQLRIDLADRLRAAGVSTPWYQATLDAMTADAAADEVDGKLTAMSRVARGFNADGQTDRAQGIALGLIPMAFGVGYRKDYQFRYWVQWLGRALAGPDGTQLVEDAQWLARLLTAAAPMAETRYPAGASELPAMVAPANPIAAVRVFEYLVREGTLSHTDALAGLVGSLLSHTTDADVTTFELAADMTAEMIAPAADCAYPSLAESLRTAVERTEGPQRAASIAESVASRTDIYALPTTRAEWRRALGVASGIEDEPAVDESHSGSRRWAGDDLVLRDGQELTDNEVAQRISSVEDIMDLHRNEASDSSFRWGQLIAKQPLTSSNATALEHAFDDLAPRDIEVRACLAEWAEANGDHPRALRLASEVLEHAPMDAWQYGDHATRRRAAAIAVRLGHRDHLVTACRSLAQHATSHTWVPSRLITELHDIVEALSPELSSAETWPAIRSHLEGIAETLDLGDADDLNDRGCQWWLAQPSGDPRPPSDRPTPELALAELVVGHISHPTWICRDAATAIVARALRAGNSRVADALDRFAQAATTDDALEPAGRCLAAATSDPSYALPASLQQLARKLAEHPSQILRHLASQGCPRPYRPLRHAYRLALPPPEAQIGSEAAFLAPHERQLLLLAEISELDPDTLLAVAAQYAAEALELLPAEQEIRSALTSAGMRHTYATMKVLASRAAFGRVLADLADARMLDTLPPHAQHKLRTVDVEALTRAPRSRPEVVPQPPIAGSDQTREHWRADTESRMDQYTGTARNNGMALIAANSRFTVLNSYRLEEELVCATTLGSVQPRHPFARRDTANLKDLAAPTEHRIPDPGEPLVVENTGYPLHQARANWLAFRPDLAAALAWTPDAHTPGRWHTQEGDLAVESVWWVDGWWGRGDARKSDDTAAEGHAVILSAAGHADVSTAFGQTTTSWHLTRCDYYRPEITPTEATRTQVATVRR